jgi:hypothetical protein
LSHFERKGKRVIEKETTRVANSVRERCSDRLDVTRNCGLLLKRFLQANRLLT